jgi:nucleoside-diphosphate-sugar epimerase
MKTAFVTGSTGLLGNNLVRELLACGFTVKALVRDEARARGLLPRDPRLILVTGDMEDVAAFSAALAGSDVLFHAAAYFRDSYKGGRHRAKLTAINVEGTAALIEAAYRAGIRRLVHVSSVGTLSPSAPGGAPVHGRMRLRPDETANDYYRSKILADGVVEQALSAHSDLWATFILPAFMQGPGDAGPTSAGQTIIDFVRRKIPGIIGAAFSYVDARDVAKACVAAAELGQRGERYVVAGHRLPLASALAMLEAITGVPAPRRRLPWSLLWTVAMLNEGWARLTGRPVLLGAAAYRSLREDGAHGLYDSTLAERALGVQFRPIEESLRDAVAWLRGAGMLPERAAALPGVAELGARPMPAIDTPRPALLRSTKLTDGAPVRGE